MESKQNQILDYELYRDELNTNFLVLLDYAKEHRFFCSTSTKLDYKNVYYRANKLVAMNFLVSLKVKNKTFYFLTYEDIKKYSTQVEAVAANAKNGSKVHRKYQNLKPVDDLVFSKDAKIDFSKAVITKLQPPQNDIFATVYVPPKRTPPIRS